MIPANRIAALDIGGANLKAAHGNGQAVSRAFPLWQRPAELPAALRSLLADLPPADELAVTMTGECCDAFASRSEGVQAILDAVENIDPAARIWQTTGRFVDIAAARQRPLEAASANWLALASYAGRLAPRGPALLLDIGSTTTDIVPLRNGQPVPRGRTDGDRLRCGELVYTGVRRTPLCALLPEDSSGWPYTAELFATTLDVYLVLGEIAESASSDHTADGRPATRAAAHARLARMLGADVETCTEADRLMLARKARACQLDRITAGLRAVTADNPPRAVVLAGEGEFLGRRVLADFAGEVISLAERIGAAASQAACAHALVALASEACHD